MSIARGIRTFHAAWALAAIGCSGGTAGAEKPSAPVANVAPPPDFEVSKMPEEPSATPPAASTTPPPAPPPEPARKPKTMQPKFDSEKGVSTIVGTQGAVFRVGAASLRVPEEALEGGKDLHLGPSKAAAAKGEPARLGLAYEIGPAIASAGAPFELTLTFPEGTEDVVLVTIVHPAAKDPKDPRPKTEITAVPPKHLDPEKHGALFELPALPEGVVYLAARSAVHVPIGGAAAPAPAPSGAP